jgi:hypothetical protein
MPPSLRPRLDLSRSGRTGVYILSLTLRRPKLKDICDTKAL